MNKVIETTMLTRETAGATSFVRGIDIFEGDLVQIKGPGHSAGRIGKVIGLSYVRYLNDLRFTVMFSDKESASFSGDRLRLIRKRSKRG